jgi:hypothetical protein
MIRGIVMGGEVFGPMAPERQGTATIRGDHQVPEAARLD